MADKKEQKNEVSNDYIQDLLNKLKVSLDNYDNENAASSAQPQASDEIAIKLDELSTEDFLQEDDVEDAGKSAEESLEATEDAETEESVEETVDETETPEAVEEEYLEEIETEETLEEEPTVEEALEEDEAEQPDTDETAADEAIQEIEEASDTLVFDAVVAPVETEAEDEDKDEDEDDIVLSDDMEQLELEIQDEDEKDEEPEEEREPSNVELPAAYTEQEEDYSLEDDLPWELAKKEADAQELELDELDEDDTVDINTLMIRSAKVRVRRYRITLVSRRPDKIAPIEMMPKIEQVAETREEFFGTNATFDNLDDDNFNDVLHMVNRRETEEKTAISEPVIENNASDFEETDDYDDAPTAQFVSVSKNADLLRESATDVEEIEDYPELDDLNDVKESKESESEYDISEYSISDLSFEEDSANYGTTNYNYPNEVSRIKTEYRKSLRIEKIKMISIAVLTFLLLLLENSILINVNFASLLNIESNPAMYALLDMQIFIIIAAMSYLELFNGAKAIIEKKLSPESFCVCATLFVIAFNIVLCVKDEFLPMYSFAAAMVLLACHISKYVDLCSQRDTFESYSAQGDKLVAEIVKNQDVAATLRSRFGEDKPISVMRIKKVGYVNGYLDRISKKSNDDLLNTILLVASISASLALGVAALIIVDFTLLVFMSAFVSTFMFSVAFSIFFAHVLPMYFVEKNASREHCAIVGEYSVDEYTSMDFVSFEDVEAFPTRKAKIRGIKIFGSDRPDEILYNMSSIFATVGGPLDGIFRVSVSDLGMSNDVKILSVATNGVSALVDGRELRVGRGDYMEKNGITLFYDSDDEAQLEDGNVSIMFLSQNGELVAKFYVEYNISSRFLANVKKLNSHGIRSVIRTYDPNIDEKLLQKLVPQDADTISVVKKMPENVNDYAQLCIDSGLVTGESSRDIIKMIFSCFKLKKAVKVAQIVMIAGVAIGIIFSALAVASGIVPVPSIMMTLVSFLTLVPVAVLSKFILK